MQLIVFIEIQISSWHAINCDPEIQISKCKSWRAFNYDRVGIHLNGNNLNLNLADRSKSVTDRSVPIDW